MKAGKNIHLMKKHGQTCPTMSNDRHAQINVQTENKYRAKNNEIYQLYDAVRCDTEIETNSTLSDPDCGIKPECTSVNTAEAGNLPLILTGPTGPIVHSHAHFLKQKTGRENRCTIALHRSVRQSIDVKRIRMSQRKFAYHIIYLPPTNLEREHAHFPT